MSFLTLIGLGFLELASPAFGNGAPIPIGAGAGAPSFDDFNAPLVGSLSVEPQAPAGSGIFIPIHKPSDFPFVTIVKDDGHDSSAAWQEAKANLPFQKIGFPITVIMWYCPITIGMPIRHSVRGYISPATAATMSAAVTNSVASNMNFDLPQGVFCHKFFIGVEATFPALYPDLGARVAK